MNTIRIGEAAISIAIADARLSRAMTRAIGSAVRGASASLASGELPVVRLRTRRRLESLGDGALAGVIAVVRVTERNARRLPDLVDAIRAARPLGVQLVWDGRSPERARVERHVFAVLERARATPSGPPVVLARGEEPVEALRILVANGQRKDDSRS